MSLTVDVDKAPARDASNESLFAALARIYYANESHRPKSHSGKLNKSIISGPASSSFAHVAHIGYAEDQGFLSTGVDQPEESTKIDVFEGGRLDKSMISGPASNSLVHVAHIGYNEDRGFTSTGVDPSWTHALGQPEDTSVEMEIMAASTSSIFDKSIISGPETNSFAHVAHIGYSDSRGFTSTGVDPWWTDALDRLEDTSIEREIVAMIDVHVSHQPPHFVVCHFQYRQFAGSSRCFDSRSARPTIAVTQNTPPSRAAHPATKTTSSQFPTSTPAPGTPSSPPSSRCPRSNNAAPPPTSQSSSPTYRAVPAPSSHTSAPSPTSTASLLPFPRPGFTSATHGLSRLQDSGVDKLDVNRLSETNRRFTKGGGFMCASRKMISLFEKAKKEVEVGSVHVVTFTMPSPSRKSSSLKTPPKSPTLKSLKAFKLQAPSTSSVYFQLKTSLGEIRDEVCRVVLPITMALTFIRYILLAVGLCLWFKASTSTP
ncbi:hypothetical protein K438DRAFT_1965580 [Mycena galopus ATCC 62051]|nr:hypothetical protein K438DRAFT_1965580 [Mycena galopus ATCC 62051]